MSDNQRSLAVQKIVDRIIFLRIAEDKGGENYGNLLKTYEKKQTPKEDALKSSIYIALAELLNKTNKKYNSCVSLEENSLRDNYFYLVNI